MSRARAVRSLKEALPKTPSKRVDVLQTYLNQNTPAAKTVKSNLNHEPTTKCPDNTLTDNVLNNIRSFIGTAKHKRSNDARNTMNVISASVSGENLSKKRLYLANKLGVTPRRLSGGKRIRKELFKGDKSCFQFTERKTRSDCISAENKKLIYEFWKSPGISRPSCNKNEIKRVRLGKNVYSSHALHVLEKTQTECFLDFKSHYPNIQLSQRTFEKCRPYFVQPAREKHRNTCCCRYHTEIHYVFKSCMSFRKANHQAWSPEEQLRHPIFDHLSDVVDCTLCTKPPGQPFSKKECIDRACHLCGVQNFKLHPTEMNKSTSVETVRWTRYEYVNLNVKGRCIRKLMLVQKNTSPGELFSYFKDILSTFSSHSFRATWQNDQLKTLIDTLPLNECIAIHDFSENYACSEKDELQSTFFSKTECTIHVTILHRHATNTYDGEESTLDNPKLITEQLFTISPDLKHDNCFTREVQIIIADHMKDVGYNVKRMHEFTDGCSTQYKSRHCMGDVSNIDLGYPSLIRNYFETSHAKGPQDAAGGCVKHMADMAVIRGSTIIQNAKDFYNYGKNNLTSTKSICKRRIFKYLETVNRDNKTSYNPIPNNRQVHQIIRDGSFGQLQIRELGCYSCGQCIDGKIKRCENGNICGTLKSIKVTAETERHDVTEPSDDLDENMPSFRGLIQNGSVIAAYTDDPQHEYYLLQAIEAPNRLTTETSDKWGNTFSAGVEVVRGYYYETKCSTNSYRLLSKQLAIVPFLSVRYLCSDVGVSKNNITIGEDLHMNILESIDQFYEITHI
ncbi:MAG: hypothetical protein ABW185_24515 [Sedimenticola sp.]